MLPATDSFNNNWVSFCDSIVETLKPGSIDYRAAAARITTDFHRLVIFGTGFSLKAQVSVIITRITRLRL